LAAKATQNRPVTDDALRQQENDGEVFMPGLGDFSKKFLGILFFGDF
jgi:hypothetical protein